MKSLLLTILAALLCFTVGALAEDGMRAIGNATAAGEVCDSTIVPLLSWKLERVIRQIGLDTTDWRADSVNVHVGGSWPCALYSNAVVGAPIVCETSTHYKMIPVFIVETKKILDTLYRLTPEQVNLLEVLK